MIKKLVCFYPDIIGSKSPRIVANTSFLCYNISIDGKEIPPLLKSKTSVFLYLLSMKLLSLKQVADRYVCNPKTITRKVSAGILPKPIVLWQRSNGTSAANRWREQDLINFEKGITEW